MKRISEYRGNLFNHMQGFYRPGDHDLAVELLEALGLACVDVETSPGYSLLRIHLNPDDRDNVDNVLFLAELRPAHARLEEVLRDRAANDAEFAQALADYEESAKIGDSVPHFGIHYPSTGALEAAKARVAEQLSPALKARVDMIEMPGYGAVADFPDMRQVFVRTDVFAFGSTTLGQTIELQVERGQ